MYSSRSKLSPERLVEPAPRSVLAQRHSITSAFVERRGRSGSTSRCRRLRPALDPARSPPRASSAPATTDRAPKMPLRDCPASPTASWLESRCRRQLSAPWTGQRRVEPIVSDHIGVAAEESIRVPFLFAADARVGRSPRSARRRRRVPVRAEFEQLNLAADGSETVLRRRALPRR